MKKAAIYVRVSTPDQHVESQLYDLRELAAQRGFEVVHEYEDRGVCGKKARRPGLDALMADARRKKFSVVLVAAFDRIARSTRNFLQKDLLVVPGGGVEPPRAEARRILSPLRLPVPPSRRGWKCLIFQSNLRDRFCHLHRPWC